MKRAKTTGHAPCGHPGEHIIGDYVRCVHGCEGKPDSDLMDAASGSLLNCTHRNTGRLDYRGVVSCAKCGKILERGHSI